MENYKLNTIEQSTVLDADFLLRKNRITGKVYGLFGALQEQLAADPGIAGAGSQPAKISKGEQYRGLPWVVLDYPRTFGRDDIFACRTFFWWGRFFSATLHLAGHSLERYREGLRALQGPLGDWHVCVQDDAWEHHFEPENYRRTDTLTAAEWEKRMAEPFVKLAKRYDLMEWENIIAHVRADYSALLELLKGAAAG
ncbi:hypothetical protein ACWKWU_10840 [Chitinophaga lutea]